MSENDSVKTTDQSTDSAITTLPLQASFSLPVTVFKKQNFILENEDLNQIAPLLFLGSLEAAKNVELLKKLNITHVLTVEDHPLEPEIHKHFVEYKFKQIYDHPYSNILDIIEECVDFIENALKQNTGVLVHWYIFFLKNILRLTFLVGMGLESGSQTHTQAKLLFFKL